MQTPVPYTSQAATLRHKLRHRVLNMLSPTSSDADFDSLALAIFQYQSTYNTVYRTYLRHLRINPAEIKAVYQIPFLPISFFKTQSVKTGDTNVALTFASSGTTGEQTSRHLITDPDLYDLVSRQIFEQVYGPLRGWHIVALLPSYLERNNSSLVYMVQRFMQSTDSPLSGFYLNNLNELTTRLRYLAGQPDGRKILLIGVTFGLLDWADSGNDLSFLSRNGNIVVMETGGMKGRRKELLREEVHDQLIRQLGVPTIHSEYGMTELLSQAYSPGEGIFQASATMRIYLRDINDPFCIFGPDYTRSGGINVVDLANLDSCSFIETQDLGQFVTNEKETPDNGAQLFRVIGRFDNADIRGCNLMVV